MMATEQPPVPLNGNYAPQQTQGFGAAELNYNSQATKPAASNAAGYGDVPPSTTNTAAAGNGNSADLPSDEVGWYFVERYYTALSRQPEKLFLFYQKRSQFVSGVEAEKAPVCVGQKAINDRIKELDIQDCKVRVTNVDSQSSDNSIVIQVIGEISNKSAPHRKFTQTFVLAKQTNGYFVLNDIFRYITEDEEFEGPVEGEEPQQNQALASGTQEPAPSVEETEPRTLTSSDDPAAREHDASKVDKELEEKVLKEDPTEPQEPAVAVDEPATIDAEIVQQAEDSPAAAVSAVPAVPAVPAALEETAPAIETQIAEATQELVPEKPKAPEATPVASTPPASTAPSAIAAPPPKPAAPKTWANLAAAAHNRIATPATPAVQSTPPPAANQAKAAPPAQPSTTTAPNTSIPTAPAAQTTSGEEPAASSPQDEWQSVNHDHSKRQSRAPPVATEQQNSRAYIKNVYESVSGEELRKTLEKYGEIAYFDISRQKNCAFVDFATPAGFQAAVAANPHNIGNDRIYVEERRLRPGSYPYVPRGRGDVRGGRGGGSPRDGGRGGFQQKPAFAPRGRGSANVGGARGRGAAQAA